ncbi:MAG: membrane dipeptidase [Oscillospiraceae bacterium]|nr:membrane dipeptidase [Oscillospiraceae bacterium]
MGNTDECKNIANVIDLHCDTLSKSYDMRVPLTSRELAAGLDRLPDGVRLCQCMAIFIPDRYRGEAAEAYFDALYRHWCVQLKLYKNRLRAVTQPDEIAGALNSCAYSAILTVEGGAALGGKLDNVRRLWDLGVRMMTLTWNGANEIAGGVSTDRGFTPFGRKAVGEMEKLGMIVDVSHLSDRGFSELMDFAQRPFIASHSNSRAVCSHPRNLTDEMFKTISRSGGLVGLNYYKNFIADNGDTNSIDDLIRHACHFLELGGEDTIALGSDFDGAELPEYLDGLEKLPSFFDAMGRAGIPPHVIEKIRYKNAQRFFTSMK